MSDVRGVVAGPAGGEADDTTVVCDVDVDEASVLSDSRALRVAVAGNVDAGKTTTVSNLVRARTDDGRGSAREAVMRHPHEKETGRTSSVAVEIMGFSRDGDGAQCLPFRDEARLARVTRPDLWRHVHAHAGKIVAFTDLAGHEAYLREFCKGAMRSLPHCAMFLVNTLDNGELKGMATTHLNLILDLRVPFFVVLTKLDLSVKHIGKTAAANALAAVKQHVKRATGRRCLTAVVSEAAQVDAYVDGFANQTVVPVIKLSNVSGKGLDVIRRLLYLTPVPSAAEALGVLGPPVRPAALLPRVYIDDVYTVPGVSGKVVCGTVTQGVVRPDSTLLLGPDANGRFNAVRVRTIQIRYTPVDAARVGDTAGFAVRPVDKAILDQEKSQGGYRWAREGMQLVHAELKPEAVWTFRAAVKILHHQTTILPGTYAAVFHIGPVMQEAKIKRAFDIEDGATPKDCLRTGDEAVVECEFVHHAVGIEADSKFMFRQGNAQGTGVVLSVRPDKDRAAAGPS